jgi:hypothetical protein
MEDIYKRPYPDYKTLETTIKVVSDEQPFKAGKMPGTAITGFIDVEKFVCFDKQTFFLEKKLPFQILIISTCDDHPGNYPPTH